MNDWTLDDLQAQKWAEGEQARIRKVREGGIKVVCAWCGAAISGNPSATYVSHGMCDKCFKAVTA